MNILITGGSGFIGRNLIEYLGVRHSVLAPTHKELELLDENAVRSYFRSLDIDVVIHAAVRPGHRNAPDPSSQLYNNTRMFFNIIRNKGYFRKIIVLGSGLVYGLDHYIPKMKETYFDTHVPADEGGFSKYIIAKHLEKIDYAAELRVFGIFGKYEDYAIRFISNAICKTIFDLPITIKQNRVFDYIYIDDLMPVIDHFINGGKPGAYNVCSGEPAELKVLAENVRKISGKGLPIVISQDGMGQEYSGDNGLLKKEIPGLRFAPLDEAIEKLYRWYSENRGLIKKESLLIDK